MTTTVERLNGEARSVVRVHVGVGVPLETTAYKVAKEVLKPGEHLVLTGYLGRIVFFDVARDVEEPPVDLLDFIAEMERNYFRTQWDVGANFNALFLWNQVRKHAGLPKLCNSDLACEDDLNREGDFNSTREYPIMPREA